MCANWQEVFMSRYQVRELLPPPYSRRSPSTVGDWLNVVRRGLPGRGVEGLLEAIGLTRTEFCVALNIPERTLARRLTQGRLTPDESEKVLRLGRVWERATIVLTNDAAARDWLKSPNGALENAAPLSLLDADIGADAVLDLLGRIEHGVFS
jgi:putative toxin-antitoxin system antitoxin component (TIGR02293 family)